MTARALQRRSTVPGLATRAALAAILVVVTLAPVGMLLLWSVSGGWLFPSLLPGQLTSEAWHAIGAGALTSAIYTSAALAIATAVIACALALPIGRALARLRGWRRHVGAAAAFLPVASPPLALGTGLQVMALAAGVGGTAIGVLFAHIVPAVGYLALFFLGTFTLFDTRAEAEARTLGATAAQTWWRVTLPLLRRPIVEAMAVGFLISWTQFALTLVVGGGAVRTLPLEVFALVRAGEDRASAVGALLLLVPALAALAGLRWATRRTALAPA
ncbi:MAG: ABC transporter permease subunit [Gemmatimonadaceae bacterium]